MQNKILIDLLKKYLEGNINEEEEKELFILLNYSENICISEELNREFKNSTINLNSNEVWKKIKSKIACDSEIILNKKLTIYDKAQQLLKYAALIIFFVVLATFYKLYFRKNTFTKTFEGNVFQYSVPYGSKSNILLSDGSKVWINSGSTIKFNNEYGVKNRMVFLEGEAFFEVTTNKKMPFCVKVDDNLTIKAYGTKFNVKSFKNEKNIQAVLISGSVVIEKRDDKGKITHNIIMKPNEIVTYSREKEIFTTIKPKVNNNAKFSKNEEKNFKFIESLDISNEIEVAISWKNNRLVFRSEDFESLILKLERWYNVEITLKNEKLKEYKFTGSFDNETIEQALDALRLTAPFSYTIKKNKIIIY